MNEDSASYKAIDDQKYANLVEEQLEYQRQAIEIKRLLAENEALIASGQEGFMTGDMIDELTSKLKGLLLRKKVR